MIIYRFTLTFIDIRLAPLLADTYDINVGIQTSYVTRNYRPITSFNDQHNYRHFVSVPLTSAVIRGHFIGLLISFKPSMTAMSPRR